MSRAQRLLRDTPEGAEHGWLLYRTDVEAALDGPDADTVVAKAREGQRTGHRLGRDPQPGLALLRLAQGRPDAAAASIRAALAAVEGEPLARARLRAAQVEIACAAGDTETAREASDDSGRPRPCTPPRACGPAPATPGAPCCSPRDTPPRRSPISLRAACGLWRELRAPYDGARVRVLLVEAYRALGDEDAAELELASAEETLSGLGASSGSRRVAGLRRRVPLPGGLTEREAEVLARVAEGRTNREVAAALVVSEKTVARHSPGTFRTSSPSSACHRARRRPPTPSSTSSPPRRVRRVGRTTHPSDRELARIAR